MTWYADDSVCDYLQLEDCSSLRAIGWLERGHVFSTGTVKAEVYRRLKELLRAPWQPACSCGTHACNLCAYEGEVQGVANLFVPGNGCVYVCPELILHYMNAHGYAPPEDFCSAVLSCPDTNTMDYKKALLKNGLKAKKQREALP